MASSRVGNKNFDTVEVSRICAHYLNVEAMREYLHIFAIRQLVQDCLMMCMLFFLPSKAIVHYVDSRVGSWYFALQHNVTGTSTAYSDAYSMHNIDMRYCVRSLFILKAFLYCNNPFCVSDYYP